MPRRVDRSERWARWRSTAAERAPRLLALAQRVFLLVALAAITFYLWRHAGELEALLSRRVLLHCLVSALVLAALHPLIGVAAFQLQRSTGIALDLRVSLAVYMRRIPARYVPGGIWHAVSRYADMKFDAGVDAAALRRLFVLEMAAVATSGFLICASGLWTLPPQTPVWSFAALQGAAGLVVAAAGMVLAWRKAWKRVALGFVLYLVVWAGAASAFTVVAAAAGGAQTSCSAGAIGSSYLVAASQGYVAIFAPQGWGVAETSFALLNPCGITPAGAIAAFLLFRLSGIFGDVLSYAVWTVLMRRKPLANRAPVQVD